MHVELAFMSPPGRSMSGTLDTPKCCSVAPVMMSLTSCTGLVRVVSRSDDAVGELSVPGPFPNSPKPTCTRCKGLTVRSSSGDVGPRPTRCRIQPSIGA
jgi:hypothetical protein